MLVKQVPYQKDILKLYIFCKLKYTLVVSEIFAITLISTNQVIIFIFIHFSLFHKIKSVLLNTPLEHYIP